MFRKILRFIPPLLVAGGALYVAVWSIGQLMTNLIAMFPGASTYDLIPRIPLLGPTEYLEYDINWLLTWIAPIMIVEYFVLGIPVSALMLVISKYIKGTSHNIDIIQTGNKFGARRMIQRAIVPALLALALGSVIQSYLAGSLINVPQQLIEQHPDQVLPIWNPLFN